MLYLCFCLLISNPAELLIWFYILSQLTYMFIYLIRLSCNNKKDHVETNGSSSVKI